MDASQDSHPTNFFVALRLELRALYIQGKLCSSDQHICLALHFPWTLSCYLFLIGNELLIFFVSFPAQQTQTTVVPDVPLCAPTFSVKATDQNVISVWALSHRAVQSLGHHGFPANAAAPLFFEKGFCVYPWLSGSSL